MKTFKMVDVKIDESQIRPLLDSFWLVNDPDKLYNVDARRSSDTSFDIQVRYRGELVLPFGDE